MDADNSIAGWNDLVCRLCGLRCSIYFIGEREPGYPRMHQRCFAESGRRAQREANARKKASFRRAGLDDTLPRHNGKNPRMDRRGKG